MFMGHNVSSSDIETMMVLSGVIALVCTILGFVFIIPEKRREYLNKFGKVLADILNFKSILLEKIIKFVYIFSTVFVILVGFFRILLGDFGEIGLLMMIVCPLLLRIIYEPIMMFIVLVRNSTDINRKLKDDEIEDVSATPTIPVMPIPPAPTYVAPNQAPLQNNVNVRICPNCKSEIKNAQSEFCTICGTKL